MKKASDFVNSQFIRSIETYDKLSNSIYELMHLNKEKHNLWVVVKQQKLTILTDNPYLGTQLQYQQQTICDALNRKFLLELKKTKVKIISPKAISKPKSEPRFVISEKASTVLESIANDIEDSELKASLLQLTKKKKQDQV
ncbi:MAG TPA: DUF721 domain-containing protein [Leucothrix sp.]|nr:DUF721 domain-containing protein [Leucothrix sp.]HIQ15818.1 DUF721 domain-containing protein [Leucothrix sp.]